MGAAVDVERPFAAALMSLSAHSRKTFSIANLYSNHTAKMTSLYTRFVASLAYVRCCYNGSYFSVVSSGGRGGGESFFKPIRFSCSKMFEEFSVSMNSTVRRIQCFDEFSSWKNSVF